ncbi:antibiotic biosynthesis monooxygenase [Pseudomonas sp. CDFA 602]|uniref:putative quinol monooxygenase n=1 Tax=Pseudomonas californiensis TaxID=2829823 RepID=UPI001E61BF03|nr:putative quinol monooxygenase [Pseudomonas californiensis]MCD5996340.1 antibiotic biosynthesis monooxygenase [Pseudomonas californiensis]MCD6001939.1 antibiotic biosynthesis monooxygenase [Pseudomonas californiensis]
MPVKSYATEIVSQGDPGDKGRALLIRIAQIQVDPKQLEQYRDASRRMVEESVAQEPGVLAFYALERRDVPGGFFVVEIYRDEEGYQSHLKTQSFRQYKAAVAGSVQSLELIDVDVVALATKPSDHDLI